MMDVNDMVMSSTSGHQYGYKIGSIEPWSILGYIIYLIVMLVTSLCWWRYDGDWFEMLVAELCIESVNNISKLSPTHLVPKIRHRHRCKPISVLIDNISSLGYRQHEKNIILTFDWSIVTPTPLIWHQYFGNMDIVYFKINTRSRPITSGFYYKTFDMLNISEPHSHINITWAI